MGVAVGMMFVVAVWRRSRLDRGNWTRRTESEARWTRGQGERQR